MNSNKKLVFEGKVFKHQILDHLSLIDWHRLKTVSKGLQKITDDEMDRRIFEPFNATLPPKEITKKFLSKPLQKSEDAPHKRIRHLLYLPHEDLRKSASHPSPTTESIADYAKSLSSVNLGKYFNNQTREEKAIAAKLKSRLLLDEDFRHQLFTYAGIHHLELFSYLYTLYPLINFHNPELFDSNDLMNSIRNDDLKKFNTLLAQPAGRLLAKIKGKQRQRDPLMESIVGHIPYSFIHYLVDKNKPNFILALCERMPELTCEFIDLAMHDSKKDLLIFFKNSNNPFFEEQLCLYLEKDKWKFSELEKLLEWDLLDNKLFDKSMGIIQKFYSDFVKAEKPIKELKEISQENMQAFFSEKINAIDKLLQKITSYDKKINFFKKLSKPKYTESEVALSNACCTLIYSKNSTADTSKLQKVLKGILKKCKTAVLICERMKFNCFDRTRDSPYRSRSDAS